jgi:uncharacterized protein YeaO (DUF488 family)
MDKVGERRGIDELGTTFDSIGPDHVHPVTLGRMRGRSTVAKTFVRVGRIYDESSAEDGRRVLVDRVWPRGLSKERARIDEWCKQIAPSTQLRQWYDHDPARYAEFARRYRVELEDPERATALLRLRAFAREGTLTLLTATKRSEISQAAVLAELLQHPSSSQGRSSTAS